MIRLMPVIDPSLDNFAYLRSSSAAPCRSGHESALALFVCDVCDRGMAFVYRVVLGCVIPPLTVGASSRNLGHTLLAISVCTASVGEQSNLI